MNAMGGAMAAPQSPTTRRRLLQLDLLNLRGCLREPDTSPAWEAIKKQNGWEMPSPGILHRPGVLVVNGHRDG